MSMRFRAATTLALVIGLAAVGLAVAEQWRVAGLFAAVLVTATLVVAIGLLRAASTISDDLSALRTRLGEVADDRDAASKQVVKRMSAALKNQTREVEALLQLYGWIESTEPMPPSGQWAMNPQGLLALFAHVRRNRPRTVVELGSGTSTVWLGYAVAANGPVGDNGDSALGRLISLDHEASYAEASRELVGRHTDRAAPTEVRHAPLEQLQLGSQSFRWYSLDALDDIPEIDMLIIDGPPAKTGRLARYPAVPALADRLADGAVVVLDDATRDDEKAAATRWIEENRLVREPSPISRLAFFRYSAKPVDGEVL